MFFAKKIWGIRIVIAGSDGERPGDNVSFARYLDINDRAILGVWFVPLFDVLLEQWDKEYGVFVGRTVNGFWLTVKGQVCDFIDCLRLYRTFMLYVTFKGKCFVLRCVRAWYPTRDKIREFEGCVVHDHLHVIHDQFESDHLRSVLRSLATELKNWESQFSNCVQKQTTEMRMTLRSSSWSIELDSTLIQRLEFQSVNV